MNRRTFLQGAGAALGVTPLLQSAGNPEDVDLKSCVIVTAEGAPERERKAATALAEEVQKRSQLRWQIQNKPPSGSNPVIYLGTRNSARRLGPQVGAAVAAAARLGPDGFAIASGGQSISIVGADDRGLLFGVGKLLRTASFGRQTASLSTRLVNGSTSPKYLMRGHQLGYRPKTNAYDAWDVSTWDQYIRDLAMFGTNAIELVPPRSDDDADSPHFPLPPEQMMVEMSRICDSYGLDVWIWYPAMDPDYADPATVTSALKEWEHFYQVVPRIDAIFVPGGDPGHTEPKAMLAFLEKQKASLRRFHPKAQMWMSPQGFNEA